MVEEKTLTSLPLEVRHTIFEYAAIRDFKPRELLRYWFEKKELKALIAQHAAADPDGPAPRVVHDRHHDVDSDVTESEHGDEEADSEGVEAQEDEENEEPDDEDEEAEHEDGEDDDEVDDEEHAEDPSAEEVQDEEAEDAMEEDQDTEGSVVAQPSATDHSPIQPHTHDVIEQEQIDETGMQFELEGGEEQEDAANAQAEPAEAAPQEAQDNTEEDGDEAMGGDGDEEAADNDDGDGGADTTTPAAPPPPQPAPIIRAAPKWRHIPKFMRVTHCPPPVELLVTSKQLHHEANNWFYDVAVLRIEATASFAHTSFFEEAFSQITEAAFSPMENIRKVEVNFVWDTTWLRAEDTGFAVNIFPALLRQRSEFVYQILSQAPDLKEVTVHWHDSAQDDESANFMLDILAAFHSLPATIKIEEHYIALDAKPRKRSIAGKRRVEFQNIMDNGIDRLL